MNMDIDFSGILDGVKGYFSSLNDVEKYSFIAIIAGFILLILSWVIW